MKRVHDKNKLTFQVEEGDFLSKIFSDLKKCSSSMTITGSVAFFGHEYLKEHNESDIDFLILDEEWCSLLEKYYTNEVRYFFTEIDTEYSGYGYGTISIHFLFDEEPTINLIICVTKDVLRKWKFATKCMMKLCEVEKMKYALKNNKFFRVKLFELFCDEFERIVADDYRITKISDKIINDKIVNIRYEDPF